MPKTQPESNVQNPNFFLDELLKILGCKNDAALARTMKVAPPVLSKVRHGRLRVSAAFLIKAYDATGMSINDLRALLYLQQPGTAPA